MDTQKLLRLYRIMLTARRIDKAEQEITSRGEAFFHLSGAGHESTAALADYLTPDDWLHCHYRSRALLLARGVQTRCFFDSLLCNAKSSSLGRRMSAFHADPKLNILSMVTPVGNNALQAVGVASAIREQASRPIVLCGIGDGTSQQGEFLEAVGEAARRDLPVLFLIEDNQWAISTQTTGRTFYNSPGSTDALFGVPVTKANGKNVIEADKAFSKVVAKMRESRQPAIVVLEVERLSNHTNADDHTIYRTAEDLADAALNGDPIRICEKLLKNEGVPQEKLEQIQISVSAEVEAAEEAAFAEPDPTADQSAKRPLPVELTHPSRESRGEGEPALTMRDALREVLRHRLATDKRVTLFGEDIEDPKGDVFGVTKTLSTQFPGRVLNAPLTESTIVGVSIGQALAGQRPVAFIQFADFMPLANNQIVSELATMYWRTAGQWECPVIMLAACGACRPGLGPYHAQTGESIMAHTPGLDVFMPSNATDAAGMLNAAFESGRPTLMLYPKACLNDPKYATPTNVQNQFVPIGPARRVRAGRDVTFVAWGNTVRICEQTAASLERVGIESEIIDLRSLSPWDQRTVIASAEKTARLIAVHEDNHTCGIGAEVLATVAEKARVPVAMRRVTRKDTHVPCNFQNQLELLPTFKSVLNTAAELLDLDVEWETRKQDRSGTVEVDAVGSGPSDETVIVVEWLVGVGDVVQRGDPIASLEATKSVFEMTSTVSGKVLKLIADEGETVNVGDPILCLESGEATPRRSSPLDLHETPIIRRKSTNGRLKVPRATADIRQFDVGMSTIATVEGSRHVTNWDILSRQNARTSEDILRRTGIESRRWVGKDQNAITMAAKACRNVLEQENLILEDIDMLVCSTTSPTSVTPSMACRLLNELADNKGELMLQAFDINAACSGYLYALQSGYDYLQSSPYGRVLVVTAEVLSPLLDLDDFDTAILFGDASSATVLYGEAHFEDAKARLHRPDLSAKSDAGNVLSVPLLHDGFIQMQGKKVFSEAVRTMVTSLNRACERRGVDVSDLKMIVPHQANQRILDAIENRINTPVYSNIRNHGNTSSSSIPLCLSELLPNATAGERYGLCAFGGGFTFGASILEMN
ncbi:MAG: beta-ketoacyl-ACP synthase 3 [Planctomycetales bacterium]|nr:beta-ketoacyl-ACP synthase 3 [Planctomycetales bacterium]